MASRNPIARRDLLKRIGAAATIGIGFPTLINARALGAEDVPPASDRINIGFIGVGIRGMFSLNALINHAVAVCDVDRTVLAQAKALVEATNGKCAAYTDYRRLLENKDIDAVVVSTPDHWHALNTIDACAAGKDVYCEKPLSLTIAEGQAMLHAARRYDRVVQTGCQQRSDARFRLARELVRSGRIGKVHTIRVGIPKVNYAGHPVPDSEPPAELDYDLWLGPAPEKPYNKKRVDYYFRFFWDYSGGQVTNFGVHHMDIAQWSLGMDESGPVTAEGVARYHPQRWYEVPEFCEITYKYANGTTMLCGQQHPDGITFEGEKGTIYVNRSKIVSDPLEILLQPLLTRNIHLDEGTSHPKNWLDCIKSRDLPVGDVANGHRSATVCHLGNIAIRTGRKVRWDPEREQILGDQEQAAMLNRPYRAPWKFPHG